MYFFNSRVTIITTNTFGLNGLLPELLQVGADPEGKPLGIAETVFCRLDVIRVD